MMAQSRCDIAFRGILVNEMCKILLILTGAIQMINVTAIEPGSGTKNTPAIFCVCHLCLRSQYSVLLRKIRAAVYGPLRS